MNGSYLMRQWQYNIVNRKNFFLRIISLCCWLALLVLCSWRPPDFLQELQQKYDAYKSKYPAVKIHLVINQPAFSPGDTVFFRTWYLNEELLSVKGEHIVTLDLFNGSGHSCQQMRFKVKNGKGYNQMVFRKDLPPGEYNIVAYTDWMRNFGDAWFYKKRIQIVLGKQIITPKKQDDLIKFYPEGGNFIEGVSNKVVVLGPRSTELIIRDKPDSEITKVSLDSTGLGSFVITPKIDQPYFTEWPTGRRWQLPAIASDGLSVQMEHKDSSEFQLLLPPNSQWGNKEIYAIVNSCGKIVVKQKIVIQENQPFQLKIPTQDNTDALHQLYVFDAQGKILAQRVFVPYRIKNINVKLLVSSVAKQRDSVSGTIEVSDASGNPLESDFSVTVFQHDLFKHYSMGSFYLSDLPVVVEWTEKFGSTDQTSLNDFLITQKWERINWEEVLGDKSIKLLFPFYSEAKLKGHVVSKKNGLPPPDSTVILSYLQTNTVGYEAYTKAGKFEMPLIYDFWGDDLIFCTLQYKSKSIDDSYDIIILNDSLKALDTWSSIETPEPSPYGEFSRNRDVVTQSYSFFGRNPEPASTRDQSPNAIFEDEFLGADYEINVSDYLTFPTMVDLLQEAVPFAHYRKRGSEESIRMAYRNETTLKVFKDEPLYIIDGAMTKNTAFFLSIKPEDLIFIKILNNPNKLTQLGKLGENAVIFVESKKGDLSQSISTEKLFPVVGLSRPKEFFEVKYSQISARDRVPDVRSTLYWKPSLETTKSGRVNLNFFASDDIGPMKILVQGLTKDGRPFTFEQVINVGFKPAK